MGGASATGTRTAGGLPASRSATPRTPCRSIPSDPWARMVSGLGSQHRRPARAGAGRARDRAAAQSEFRPRAAWRSAWALLRAGLFDEAIAETGTALRMSPLDSFSGFYTAIHGLALLGGAALRRGAAVPARFGGGVRRVCGPLQHADQLLRPSRPARGGAGIHRGAQTRRPAAAIWACSGRTSASSPIATCSSKASGKRACRNRTAFRRRSGSMEHRHEPAGLLRRTVAGEPRQIGKDPQDVRKHRLSIG